MQDCAKIFYPLKGGEMNMRNSQKGFTLVELLVVIAIIAVLSGVLLVAINPVSLLAKSRDAARLEDLDALNKALTIALGESEITLADYDDTCATCDSLNGTLVVTDGSGWVKFAIPAGKTGLAKYIPALPADPTNTGTNVYSFGSTAAGFYELNAVLESPDNTAKMSTDGGNAAGVYEVGTSLTIL